MRPRLWLPLFVVASLPCCASLVGVEDVQLAGGGGGATSSGGGGSSSASMSGGGGSGACGNGVQEPGEDCDGQDLGVGSCSEAVHANASGTLRCDASCHFDTSACHYCGNGKRDHDEPCDGNDLGQKSCQDLLPGDPLATGALACTSSCTFDTSNCHCGNGVVEVGEACDGDDLQGKDCTVVSPTATGTLGCSRYCQLDTRGCTPSLAAGPLGHYQQGALWPMWRGGPSHAARTDRALPKAPVQKWHFAPDAGIRTAPAVAKDGTAYVGIDASTTAMDSGFYAVAPDDGKEKWHYKTSTPASSSPAIGHDGTVYVVTTDGALAALSANGQEQWNYPSGSVSVSSPTIGVDGNVYFVAQDGQLRAVTPSGQLAWQFTLGPGGDYSSRLSVALAQNGTLYVPQAGGAQGMLYAIHPGGTQKWAVPAPSYVEVSALVAADGTVYYAGQAFDPANGAVIWQGSSWGWWGNTLSADGGLLAGQPGGVLWGLSPADGTMLWTSPGLSIGNVSPPLIDAEGVLYGGGWDNDGAFVTTATHVLARMDQGPHGGLFDTMAPGKDDTVLAAGDGLRAYGAP